MLHKDIQPGMTLRLKRQRAEAYGLENRQVEVTGIKQRQGYKVPFIQSGELFFAPSDFEKRVS